MGSDEEVVCHDCGKRIPVGETLWRVVNGTLVPVHRDCIQGFTYDPKRRKKHGNENGSGTLP